MITAVYITKAGGMAMFGLPLSVLAGLIAILGCGGGKYGIKSSSCYNRGTNN